MTDQPSTMFVDYDGKGLVPVVTVRVGHIDNVDAMRAIERGARAAEIRQGDYLQYAIARVSKTSAQYYYRTSVAGPVFGDLVELPRIIATLEARPDRGY